MTTIFWLTLTAGYGFFTWAAKRRSSAEAALCFLDGFYLALLCFGILPRAMETDFFYGAVAFSAAGVLAGLWLEKRNWGKGVTPVALFAIVTGCYFLWSGALSQREAFFLAFFGGIGLYDACAGILPEDVLSKERLGAALLSGLGFLLGTVCFAGLL